MSGYVPHIKMKTVFESDTVEVELLPMTKKQMMLLGSQETRKDEVTGKSVPVDMVAAAQIADDILAANVVSIHGLKDADGNAIAKETVLETAYFIELAGEIFEHLSNPGLSLDALKANLTPDALVVITVPNAYSLKGFLRAFVGYELIHPDHTLHHSRRTVDALLARHGFAADHAFSFVNGGSGPTFTSVRSR